ncbi:MAG TPA: PIN domain-containing protein [Solirubrobacterales bacterium]
MPGPHADEAAWGELPLLIDTSAWARAGDSAVRDQWLSALLGDRLRISPLVRLEILFSARGGDGFDRLAEQLNTIRPAPLTTAVLRAAEAGMRVLAHRSAGTQRLPIVDYLVAAAAQELGAAVIHYDSDYDRLAEVMEFESVWLAPAGSLP